jgi:hypothetical protein
MKSANTGAVPLRRKECGPKHLEPRSGGWLQSWSCTCTVTVTSGASLDSVDSHRWTRAGPGEPADYFYYLLYVLFFCVYATSLLMRFTTAAPDKQLLPSDDVLCTLMAEIFEKRACQVLEDAHRLSFGQGHCTDRGLGECSKDLLYRHIHLKRPFKLYQLADHIVHASAEDRWCSPSVASTSAMWTACSPSSTTHSDSRHSLPRSPWCPAFYARSRY